MEIKGSNGNDTLTGTDQRDDMDGRGGSDQMFGNAGDDDMDGQGGSDSLFGGAGNDDLSGGGGNDNLSGGLGNDQLTGGRGKDVFAVGQGADTVEDYRSGDRIELDPGLGIDSFADIQSLAVAVDGGDSTFIDFGGGNTLLIDDLRLSQLTAAMFGLPPGSAKASATPMGEIEPFREIEGTQGADTLVGTSGRDEIKGRGGNDRVEGGAERDDLYGGGGADSIYGGSGNDDINGGGGNDQLDGGAGDDDLTGGKGVDTFVFAGGRDEIDDFVIGETLRIEDALGITTRDGLLAAARPAPNDAEDLLIDFGSGNTLRLDATTRAELEAANLVFF